ncbi:MAG: hypothetical protein ACU85U_01415 [Gammaproteobacteria bacterium]
MNPQKPVTEPAGRRQKLMLLGLVLLFVSPILISWAYIAGLVDLGPISRTNHGNLVTPPLDLRDVDDAARFFTHAKLQPGEWVLTYVEDGPCNTECLSVLDRLLTIRSLLGYSGQRVRVIALTDSAPAAPLAENYAGHVLSDPLAHDVLKDGLERAIGTPLPAQIVFIDWRRQLVMRYDRDAPSGDLKKDLKKLLRASQIR